MLMSDEIPVEINENEKIKILKIWMCACCRYSVL